MYFNITVDKTMFRLRFLTLTSTEYLVYVTDPERFRGICLHKMLSDIQYLPVKFLTDKNDNPSQRLIDTLGSRLKNILDKNPIPPDFSEYLSALKSLSPVFENKFNVMESHGFFIRPGGRYHYTEGRSHIDFIISNPGLFNLKPDFIRDIYRKHDEPLGFEGKARLEILKKKINDGWVHLRFFPKKGRWIFNIPGDFLFRNPSRINLCRFMVEFFQRGLLNREHEVFIYLGGTRLIYFSDHLSDGFIPYLFPFKDKSPPDPYEPARKRLYTVF